MKPTVFLVPILLLGLLAVTPARAQDAAPLIMEGKALLKAGYDASDFDRIQRARALFERAVQDEAHAALAHYFAALAEQRAANLLWAKDKDQATDHLTLALEHAELAARVRSDWAEIHVLLANLYGQKATLNPLDATAYGPQANQALNRARRLAPDNPRVALIEGMSLYHKPAMFGGSKEKALAAFQEAVRRFDAGHGASNDPLAPSWGHDEAYAWAGLAHMEQGNEAAAREAFENALVINPAFGWVKYVLLPRLTQAAGAQ